jgi:hypothetical protein
MAGACGPPFFGRRKMEHDDHGHRDDWKEDEELIRLKSIDHKLSRVIQLLEQRPPPERTYNQPTEITVVS